MVAISILTTIIATTFSPTATAAAVTGLDIRESPYQGWGEWGFVNAKSCPGKLVDDGPVGKSGHWYLYYSSARKGTNCFYVVNTTGKRKSVVASIFDRTNEKGHSASDAGDYIDYAGSVMLYHMANKCIRIWAIVGNDKVNIGKNDDFHCG